MTPAGSILLWGPRDDLPLAAIRRTLLEAGYPFTFLDQHDALDTEADLLSGPTIAGTVHVRGETIDLAMVTALYLRPTDSRDLLGPNPTPEALAPAANLDSLLCSWADLTPALVLNRPTPMASNNSKPFQSAWLHSLGFSIPATLLTTDPAEAEAFWHHHGRVIYKSIGGTRSIVAELTPAHRTRLANLASCPTQFQQFIPGQEYRVHVVGQQVFACAILSEAVDYRYGQVPYQTRPADLPPEIAARCLQASQAMKLPLAGLDLRRTPQGEWFCFEVNPSPAFVCFDDPTTQPITQAVAHLLANPSLASLIQTQPSTNEAAT